MAQIDRLLSALATQGADALHLFEGKPILLVRNGEERPVTRQPLTSDQLIGLITEIAPPNVEVSSGTKFTYRSGHESFEVSVKGGNGAALSAAIRSVAAVSSDPVRLASGVGSTTAPTSGTASGVSTVTAGGASAGTADRAATDVTGSTGTGSLTVLEDNAGDERRAQALRAMDQLLVQLVERGASDLHLRTGEPPILRKDGEMIRLEAPPMEGEWLEQLLLSITPERNRKEFALINDSDFAYEIQGLARFRANVLRDRNGPAAVFRVIPATVVTVEQMGLSAEVQRLCFLTKGLVLVTGPTGSGKSTTLCALVDLVNRTRSDHVITIEDPIEFVHPNKRCLITQRQVGVHTSSFKHALRAALREDPDIILVGELRDLDTVSIAIETAETGHLVFGTLHTTTAASTIDRVIDQFPADRQEQIRVMLADSLKGVISQTLCRKIGGGRVAAREILLSIPAVSNLIREGKTFQIPSVMQTSKRLGMVTLNDALIDLVDARLVEAREAYTKALDKTSFANMLRARGHDASFIEADPSSGGAGGAPATPSGTSPARPGAAGGAPRPAGQPSPPARR